MRIIESSIIGKKSQKECEDGLVVSGSFIAVIDGSTSKTPRRISPDMRNGRYAMKLIAEYISRSLPPDATVGDFCRGVTAYIRRKVYEPQGLVGRLLRHPEERLTASAIVYSDRRRELWLVGDCQALAGGRLYDNAKPYEQEIARRRVSLIAQGVPPAEARKRIEPLLIEAMLTGQNKTYAVIDGFPIYMDGVGVVPIDGLSPSSADIHKHKSSSPVAPTHESSSPVAYTHDIVLASDGYPFLKPTLADSEAALAHLVAADPQCIRHFIATKGIVAGNRSFDDRTYVRFVP